MRIPSFAWALLSVYASMASAILLIYLFVGNESLFKSAVAAIGFVMNMYFTLDSNMEVEKARMREEQA